MMKSEFIERTGFEPTADEYEEIEREYMGTGTEKDIFCKQWKKQGGFERLMRLRARQIEELEAEIQKRVKEYDELDAARCSQVKHLEETKDAKIRGMEDTIAAIQQTNFELADEYNKLKNLYGEAEHKLSVIREAFEILTGKEKTA